MKKASRKILVPLIILALGIAIVSTVSAVEYSGQSFISVSGQNANPGYKSDNDFNQRDKNGHDTNQWGKNGHDTNQLDKKGYNFKPGYHGYWNYPFKPYYWYYQFMPYYYRYNKWFYPSPFYHPYDSKKH